MSVSREQLRPQRIGTPALKAAPPWSLPRKQVLRFVRQDHTGQQYFVFVPSSGGEGAPLFVAVHGISRNATEQAQLFSRQCEEFGVVLVAPLFPEEQSPDYQRLGRAGRGPRADQALDSIVEEATWFTGAAADRFYLFGFSGGAQFAHRYTLAHPDRVAGAVIASAGWYTFPDPRTRFPYGIRPSRDLPDTRFVPEEFLRIPMTVLVGDRDTTNEHLRCTERVKRQQGETRVDRARNWVQAMGVAANAYHLDPLVRFELVPGGDHLFAELMLSHRLGERVFATLFGQTPHP